MLTRTRLGNLFFNYFSCLNFLLIYHYLRHFPIFPMVDPVIEQAIRTVLPDLKQIDATLVSTALIYYDKSKSALSVLPQSEECARAAICAYLAASKLQSALGLPKPVSDNIPLMPSKVKKLMIDFKGAIMNVGSPRKTPSLRKASAKKVIITPRASSDEAEKENLRLTSSKRALDGEEVGLTDFSTYVKRAKRLSAESAEGAANLTSELLKLAEEEEQSPKRPRRIIKTSKSVLSSLPRSSRKASPTKLSPTKLSPAKLSPTKLSPTKSKAGSRVGSPAKHRYSPRKSSPLKGTLKAEEIELETQSKNVTTEDLVEICNTIKFPKEVTYRVIACYESYASKIKDDWGFCCGLIIAVFLRLFSHQLETRLGLRSRFFKVLLKWQRGGLRSDEMKKRLVLTENMLLSSEDWIEKLPEKYSQEETINKNFRFLYTAGSMLTPQNDYLNQYHTSQFNTWVAQVKADITGMR